MRCLLVPILLALTAPASAEVVDARPTGFTVQRTATTRAAPASLWRVLVAPARWWNPAHSWSGSAASLALDPRPGGCFCERLPGGGGVEHLRVIYADPGKRLRLVGLLGPLQADGATGTLTIEIAAAAQGSTVTWRYAVGGNLTAGGEALASPVDRVLGEQLDRLVAVSEGRQPSA